MFSDGFSVNTDMEEINVNFKLFLETHHQQQDMEKTLKTIPKKHRDLVKGYKFSVENGNTLKDDSKSVGEIDAKRKKIRIAAPWNYGRQFTFLHEIAHTVWEYLVPSEDKKKWNTMVKNVKEASKENKKNLNQNFEEIFCMVYANYYVKNRIVKFDYPQLYKFIENLDS